MKKIFLKLGLLSMLVLLVTAANGQSGHNYKYQYKASCKCIISKDNPAGIEQVSVFPYKTDPDVHEHNCGFYGKTATTKVDTFSLKDFSPKDFSCYPCMSFQPNTKYAFCFPGKDDFSSVTVCIVVDEKGEIKEEKYTGSK